MSKLEDLSITPQVQIDLDQVATCLIQLEDGEVVEFLKVLDEKMASWDFTLKVAEIFVRAGLKMTEQPGRPVEAGALARVGEFLRQARVQPHVVADQPIFGVWTDPQAAYAPLDAADLDMVVELAATALRALPDPEEGE